MRWISDKEMNYDLTVTVLVLIPKSHLKTSDTLENLLDCHKKYSHTHRQRVSFFISHRLFVVLEHFSGLLVRADLLVTLSLQIPRRDQLKVPAVVKQCARQERVC